MDTTQFLARVVSPEGYICVVYNMKPQEKRGIMVTRFFEPGDYHNAAGLLQWTSRKGFDAYHAQATFTATRTEKDRRDQDYLAGDRTHENAALLRSFWVDLDVHRDGDKKLAGTTYASQAEAAVWVRHFCDTIGMPRPSILVNSGYGLHVYWTLSDPLPRDDWLPYGAALKAALVANGFKGDAGISQDASRILRPPGTTNNKTTTPAAVELLGAGPDVLLDAAKAALQPYVGVSTISTTPRSSNASTSALAGGNVSPLFANGQGPNMNAAAASNLPAQMSVPRSFADMAKECLQIATSLAEGGEHDNRKTWYLGHLTAAHFCADGADFVHPISEKHPGYSSSETDAMVAQVAAEQQRKQVGWPSCSLYDGAKPGICQLCPHFNKIKGPLELAVTPDLLPHPYRQGVTGIEQLVTSADGKSTWWQVIAPGALSDPYLEWLEEGGYALSFLYANQGQRRAGYISTLDLTPDAGTVYKVFARMGLVLQPGNEQRFRGFIMAWINKLQAEKRVRHDVPPAYGWTRSHGKIDGFAVAGAVFRSNGTADRVGGLDANTAAKFRPIGTLEAWQDAFNLVTHKRPDLQALVAASFGSALMTFTGESGVAISGFSTLGGRGKTAALKVGQTVWSSISGMSTLQDTPNSMAGKMSELQCFPAYWDEARVDPDKVYQFVNLIYQTVQGQEKARYTAQLTQRVVRSFQTMLVMCSNRSLMNYIEQVNDTTDAGALRMLEFEIKEPDTKPDSAASLRIQKVAHNHGLAGLIYAKFLAENHALVEKAVVATMSMVNKALDADRSERFLVAGITCLLVGAKLAERAGVCKFDVPALQFFLFDTFQQARVGRKDGLLVVAETMDVGQILANYMHEVQHRRLYTDVMKQPDPTKRVQILSGPVQGQMDIQIAVYDKLMRINRKSFWIFCRKNNLVGTSVVSAMQAAWPVQNTRRQMGTGTPMYQANPRVLELDCSHPDLLDYCNIFDPMAAIASGKIAPAAGLKGNQPKV